MSNSPLKTNHPAIVFDFGGVIFDWNPYYLFRNFFDGDDRAVGLFLEEIRFSEWNFQLDIGYPFKQMVDEVSCKFPQYASQIRAFDERWIETMGGAIEPTVSVLMELHELGRPLFALSNWSREKFSLVKQQYDFLDCFKQIVISGEEKVGKPDERIFMAFLDRTGLMAEQCLFIDDSPANIRVAGKLGFDTILFRDAAQMKDEMIRRDLL